MKRNKFYEILNGGQLKLSTLMLAGVATMSIVSCNDNNLLDGSDSKDADAFVTFNVTDAQTKAIAQSGNVVTRGLINPNLVSTDLSSQKLAVNGAGAASLCLIETTVEGVNPVQADAATRAKVVKTITETFSASGHRGATEASITATPQWFYKETTNSNGELVRRIPWSWDQRYGRFYAIFPEVTSDYTKIQLSPNSYAGNPYIEFEVEEDVKNQKDLMTACTGNVQYAIRGTAPTTNLDFRHALTAVKFAVGQNLSWNKTIDKVEIRNALSKGKYTLSDKLDGTGAAWDATSLSDRKTFTLDGISVSTSQNPNTVIMGRDEDNFTFYMIPQTLTGNNVVAYFHFTDGSEITTTLSGSWVAGTTKTYKLSDKLSTWEYTLETESPVAVAYSRATSDYYKVRSYRTAADGVTQYPVKWKAVGYEEFNDATNSWDNLGTTKPSWLTALSVENGSGGTAAEQGVATLKVDVMVDRLTAYNKVLQDAPVKGSASNYYNLSNANGTDVIENTANSYLVSAPGYYRIPLVYGNAIKNGADNKRAYQTQNSGQKILSNFKDHSGTDITTPYINIQNNTNPATQASIVWADQDGIVEGLSVTNDGNRSFVNFHVPANKIKNGNAVIAVKSPSGVIMWSWHLWFDHSDALSTIQCVNKQGDRYNFSKNTLGFTMSNWEATSYDKPRKVRVKIEQEIANNSVKKFSYITIVQNHGSNKEFTSTLYQFGRKDAFPGAVTTYGGSIVEQGGNNMSISNGIQNPEKFYTVGSSWTDVYFKYNLWSMENTSLAYNGNNVVKTIYDPSPVGFRMPGRLAFTGFTTTGESSFNVAGFNVSGDWEKGWNFNTNATASTATIFFPAIGSRTANAGGIYGKYSRGYYWSAIPTYESSSSCLDFTNSDIKPFNVLNSVLGGSVRPVAE